MDYTNAPTIRELKAAASAAKVKGYGTMRKSQLLEALNAAPQAIQAEPEPQAEPIAQPEAAKESLTGKFPGQATAPEPQAPSTGYYPTKVDGRWTMPADCPRAEPQPQAIATERPPSQSQPVADESQQKDWPGFLVEAIRSTAKAYGPELRAIAQALFTALVVLITATILAGRIAGRVWRSERANQARLWLRQAALCLVIGQLGLMTWEQPPLGSYARA
jgi:hypothetical protein